MKGDTDMKPIRDKDLRLYQQVTNLDDDLILEAMTEPVTPSARRARGQRAESIQRFFTHPMVASLAVSAVILSVLVAVLLATGAFDTPTVIDPPAHGSYPEETYPPELPQVPTAEGAASLHKGICALVSKLGTDKSEYIRGESCLFYAGSHYFYKAEIGVSRLLASAKNRRISCFKAERRSINGYVGASLVNYCNYAERNTSAGDFKTVRSCEKLTRADRVGE